MITWGMNLAINTQTAHDFWLVLSFFTLSNLVCIAVTCDQAPRSFHLQKINEKQANRAAKI